MTGTLLHLARLAADRAEVAAAILTTRAQFAVWHLRRALTDRKETTR